MSHGFTISSENDDFQEKSRNVFDAIDKVKPSDECLPIKTDHQAQDSSSEDEGVCCSPTKISKPSHVSRPSKVPNYLINPEKWKKYDLKDTENLSNQENMRAAFAFLKGKEIQKKEIQEEDQTNDDHKHTFKIPLTKTTSNKCSLIKGDDKTPDKEVELEHLDEDETASEFEQTIVAKFEEELQKKKEIGKVSTLSTHLPKSPEESKPMFKTRSKVCRRNIRRNIQDGFSDKLL